MDLNKDVAVVEAEVSAIKMWFDKHRVMLGLIVGMGFGMSLMKLLSLL
jgi:hypothetical protein